MHENMHALQEVLTLSGGLQFKHTNHTTSGCAEVRLMQSRAVGAAAQYAAGGHTLEGWQMPSEKVSLRCAAIMHSRDGCWLCCRLPAARTVAAGST